MDKVINVGFTKSQVSNMIEFIELNFIESIRQDTEIDNIDYIIDMMNALQILRKANDASNEPNKNKAVKETNYDN